MSQTDVTEQSGFVRAIEPLRAFAAISVLMLHVIYLSNWMDFPKTGPLAWFWVGWLGVDIFFVISGLVVTMAAFRELATENAAPRFSFFIRRFARIAPLYFLSMAVYLVAVNSEPIKGNEAWFQITTHVFFVHNFFPSTTGAINPPTWTIGTEMQLYLFVMFVMAWLPKFRPWVFALAIFAIAIGFRYFLYSMNVGAPDSQLSHLTTQMPGMIDSFGLGMVLALLKQQGKLPQLGLTQFLVLLVCAVSGLVACEQILMSHWESYWKIWWLPAFFRSFSAIVCGLLVVAAITLPQKIQISIPRAFVFLGQISYGIYLWHFIVIMLLLKYAPMGKPAFVISVLLVTILVAAVSWIFVERPIVGMAQKYLSNLAKTTA